MSESARVSNEKGEGHSTAMNGHSSMANTLADYKGSSRPNNLLPGDRRFPDQERANLWSPCSNCSSDENNSPTALNSFNWDKPALEDKSVDFGWSPAQDNRKDKSSQPKRANTLQKKGEEPSNGYSGVRAGDLKNSTECRNSTSRNSLKKDCKLSESCKSLISSSTEDSCYNKDSIHQSTNKLQRAAEARNTTSDSIIDSSGKTEEEYCYRTEEDIIREREDLRNVAWFQAGIPREIALEVLAEKPEGSFIVRESTTKPGCYALSLRVPREKNPDGIAHYLILRTNKGYKIKGFTKEFASLKALITHHSVMPEMLPCPLSLSRHIKRDAEHEFEDTEQKTVDIFSDIHWIMTDLES